MNRFLFLILLLSALSAQARPGLLDSLGLNNPADEPLAVEQAFIFSAQVQDAHSILARWTIAEGNYLYRDKIRFEIAGDNAVQLLDYSLPSGEEKMDETFGLSYVYHHDTDVTLPLNRSDKAQQVVLTAFYQGCSSTFNICYPPTQSQIKINLAAAAKQVPNDLDNTLITSPNPPPLQEQDRIAQSLQQDSLSKILLVFFGFGLLLAFTPCVFPMIPILSSIIVGDKEQMSTHRAFVISLTYILAMSVTYTAAGVLTGIMGENLQVLLQTPWVIASFSALFVILAMSMFGLFELQLPHALQHRLHQISHRQKGGGLAGAALMGLLSGLIVGPCLAPPLAGALIFIGQSGDPFLGGSALFSLSMGMGLPLLIIGTSAGSLLPRAGTWMNHVKSVFGVLMLGLAIWMLERIIPAWVSLFLWGSLFLVSSVYLGALHSTHINSDGWHKLWKGLGIILLVYGGLLLVGAASGNHNVWNPLQGNTTQYNDSNASASSFSQINTLAELQQRLAQSNQPLLLDFYADWCVDCKTMEVTTFRDPAILSAFNTITPLQLNMTQNTAQHKEILKHFGVFGPPTILFFDASGQEYKQHRLIGSISASALTQHIANLPQQAN